MEGGSLLTIGFQILANPSPTENLTAEKIDAVTTLVSAHCISKFPKLKYTYPTQITTTNVQSTIIQKSRLLPQ
jgi:hypothetical protein